MSLPELDNLVRIGQLKAEPPERCQVEQAIAGRPLYQRLNAAHASALAALRWHGYRSENRYTVFQCLTHTLGWPANRWRVLDTAHQKRNLAEYEGYLEVEESAVAEMCALVQGLIADVQALIAK